ncbi:unnamed protein product, partial [Staurois parvus]
MGVFYWGGGLVLHCKHTALEDCAVHCHPERTDTVLMALGRKGLTRGAIKGLTVCRQCFTRELCQ